MTSPAYQCFLRFSQWFGVFKGKSGSLHKLPALTTLPLLLACGCSTFNRDWSRAANEPAPTNSIEGCWEGKWLSQHNSHSDKLRCLISQKDDEHFDARFRATYLKVFRFTYTVTLDVQPHFGGWEFSGEENLGSLGGVYYYEGRASPTNFVSTYRSKYDHGIFEMRRPD